MTAQTPTEARYLDERRAFHDLHPHRRLFAAALIVGAPGYLVGWTVGAAIQTVHHLRLTRRKA